MGPYYQEVFNLRLNSEKSKMVSRLHKKIFDVGEIIPGIREIYPDNMGSSDYHEDTHLFKEKFGIVPGLGDEEFFFVVKEMFTKHMDVGRLSKRPMVYLGSGPHCYSLGLASKFGADKYVAVDTLSRAKLYRGIDARLRELGDHSKDLKIGIVEGDLLDFLKAVPDNSISPMMFNMDYYVIRSEDQRDQIKKELVRVLSPEGVYITDTWSIKLHNQLNETPKSIQMNDQCPFFFYTKGG